MEVDRIEDIPSVLTETQKKKKRSSGWAKEAGGKKQPYFDRVEPAESRKGDEKNDCPCNPFCEWVTFGGNNPTGAGLRSRARLCRAGHGS